MNATQRTNKHREGGTFRVEETFSNDPAPVGITLSRGKKEPACEECGREFEYERDARRSKRFCSDKCRYRARDRERYERDPDAARARGRRYYAEHREQVLVNAAAGRGVPRQRLCACGAPTPSQHSPYCQRHSEEALERRELRPAMFRCVLLRQRRLTDESWVLSSGAVAASRRPAHPAAVAPSLTVSTSDDKLGFESIRLRACFSGSWYWAQWGFHFEDSRELERMQEHAQELIEAFGGGLDALTLTHPAQFSRLGEPIMITFDQLADALPHRRDAYEERAYDNGLGMHIRCPLVELSC